MKEFKVREDGVPVLSINDIEIKAEDVIKHFNADILLKPCETPIFSFLNELSQKSNFSYDLLQDLGNNLHGHKILGKFQFKPRKIFVDISVDSNLRQKFVLGHEFGHLVLHRNILVNKAGYADIDIADIEKDLITGHKLLSTPRDWLEWQANQFSSSILMPRSTFPNALIDVQKSLDIHRNLGQIYLNDQRSNLSDFIQILEKLAKIYQVTNINVEIRLKELGLLNDVRGKNTKHISELFMEE